MHFFNIKQNRIDSRIFQNFLIENGINENIYDYYSIAVLKERAYFHEAIFLIGEQHFFILLKFELNDNKFPEKVNEEISMDKSRFVISKKLYSKIKRSKRKSE